MATRCAAALLWLLASAGPRLGGACLGKVDVKGLDGDVYVQGGGIQVAGNTLRVQHNSGVSLTRNCKEDWDPWNFRQFALVGMVLSYNVDLSRVGCGCNLALYMVQEPALDPSGNPSTGTCSWSPYYCDANQVCGQWCPELDIMEANNHAFAATPHNCDASGNPQFQNCDRGGKGRNTKEIGGAYGMGGGNKIDTSRPFLVNTSFHTWGCHNYQGPDQSDQWCKDAGVQGEWEYKFEGAPGLCGSCYCCKRKKAPWVCHRYAQNQDGDWCKHAGANWEVGVEYRNAGGNMGLCGGCECCKRPTAGTLSRMTTELVQDNQALVIENQAGAGYLDTMGKAMANGLALRLTYWGQDAATMSWMDGGPCGPESCTGPNAGDAVISDMQVTPLHGSVPWMSPVEPEQPAPAPQATPAPAPAPPPKATIPLFAHTPQPQLQKTTPPPSAAPAPAPAPAPVSEPDQWACYDYQINSENDEWCKTVGVQDGVEYKFSGPSGKVCGACWCCKRPADRAMALAQSLRPPAPAPPGGEWHSIATPEPESPLVPVWLQVLMLLAAWIAFAAFAVCKYMELQKLSAQLRVRSFQVQEGVSDCVVRGRTGGAQMTADSLSCMARGKEQLGSRGAQLQEELGARGAQLQEGLPECMEKMRLLEAECVSQRGWAWCSKCLPAGPPTLAERLKPVVAFFSGMLQHARRACRYLIDLLRHMCMSRQGAANSLAFKEAWEKASRNTYAETDEPLRIGDRVVVREALRGTFGTVKFPKGVKGIVEQIFVGSGGCAASVLFEGSEHSVRLSMEELLHLETDDQSAVRQLRTVVDLTILALMIGLVVGLIFAARAAFSAAFPPPPDTLSLQIPEGGCCSWDKAGQTGGWQTISAITGCEDNSEGITRTYGGHHYATLEACKETCRDGCAAVDWDDTTKWCNHFATACTTPAKVGGAWSSYKKAVETCGKTTEFCKNPVNCEKACFGRWVTRR